MMIPQSQFRSCKRVLRERKQCIELLVMLSVSLIITDECGTFDDAKKEIAHWTLIMVERETTDDGYLQLQIRRGQRVSLSHGCFQVFIAIKAQYPRIKH